MSSFTLQGRFRAESSSGFKRRNKQPCDVTGSCLLPQGGQTTGNSQGRSVTPWCSCTEGGSRGRERHSIEGECHWWLCQRGCEASRAVKHQSCWHESVFWLSKQDPRSHGWHVSKDPTQRETTATQKVSGPVNVCRWMIIELIVWWWCRAGLGEWNLWKNYEKTILTKGSLTRLFCLLICAVSWIGLQLKIIFIID